MLQGIVVALLVAVQVMQLLLLLPKVVLGNSATATKAVNAEKLGEKSSTEYVLKENFAIIDKTLTLTANLESNSLEGKMVMTSDIIAFPQGFKKENTIVIAFGGISQKYYESKGLNYEDTSGTNLLSDGILSGAVPKSASIYSDGIHIKIANFSLQETEFKYRLILMKI